MTTVVERMAPSQFTREYMADSGNSHRCEGCPRCKNGEVGLCTLMHPNYAPMHPLCRLCHHCVLRGRHDDTVDDLNQIDTELLS